MAAPIWKKRGDNDKKYTTVISSASGQHLYVGTQKSEVFRSANFGKSWQSSSFGHENQKYNTIGLLKCTEDGKIVLVVSDFDTPYISRNYGTSFDILNIFANMTQTKTTFVPNIAMILNGQVMYGITERGDFYRSQNYGVSWNVTNNDFIFDSQLVTSGETGKYIISNIKPSKAVNGVPVCNIVDSNDFGETFSRCNLCNTFSTDYLYPYITISATGQYMAATGGGSSFQFQVSSDFGETWEAVKAKMSEGDSFKQAHQLVADPSGQFLAVVGTWKTNSPVYLSDDFGRSWYPPLAPLQNGDKEEEMKYITYNSVAIDEFRNHIVVISNDGVMYTSDVAPRRTSFWSSETGHITIVVIVATGLVLVVMGVVIYCLHKMNFVSRRRRTSDVLDTSDIEMLVPKEEGDTSSAIPTQPVPATTYNLLMSVKKDGVIGSAFRVLNYQNKSEKKTQSVVKK